ncbi:MAG: c-type cytochrome [Nitrospiria bacterium]
MLFKNILFGVLSLTLLGLLGFQVYQEENPEWKPYQRQYFQLLAEKMGDPKLASTAPKLTQTWLPDLNRTDRCMNCHMGIANPAFADQPQPFTTHPFMDGYMKNHPFEKFGCTVCHDGDGPATKVEKTHGIVHHLDRQLATGVMVQSACARCHTDMHDPGVDYPEAPAIMWGKQFITQTAFMKCGTCHAIKQYGATAVIAPELSGIGSRTELSFYLVHEFQHMESPIHTKAQWEFEHFKDPQKITPGTKQINKDTGQEEWVGRTIMPNFVAIHKLTDEQTWMLTAWVMSLRDPKVEKIPMAYSPPLRKPVVAKAEDKPEAKKAPSAKRKT